MADKYLTASERNKLIKMGMDIPTSGLQIRKTKKLEDMIINFDILEEFRNRPIPKGTKLTGNKKGGSVKASKYSKGGGVRKSKYSL